jgi:N-acetylmuramoyl-L-alanine amidase
MKIAIDAGHGMGNATQGKYDPGAVYRDAEGVYHCEADYSLKYALTLKWLCVQEKIPFFLTRTGTADPCSYRQRVRRAKEAGCTHFISFHMNSSSRPANGTETLYRDWDKDGTLATGVQEAVLRCIRSRDRGLKERTDLAVLRFPGPAALVELGFINSVQDRKRLSSRGDRLCICREIVKVLKAL